MKKHSKKLVLNRETVQLLDGPHWLKKAQGADSAVPCPTHYGPACLTFDCSNNTCNCSNLCTTDCTNTCV